MSQIVILEEQPSKLSIQSSSSSASMERLQYSFVQQSDNVGASSTRRVVRSHAMKAVRRRQRQENVETFQLTWLEKQPSNKESQPANPEAHFSELAERHSQSQDQRRSPTQEERTLGRLPSHESQEPINNRGELTTDSPSRVPSTRVNRRSERVEHLPFTGRSANSRTISSEAEKDKSSNGNIIRKFLGAGRVDPFQTFSVRTDRSMSELMDHCMLSPIPSPSVPNLVYKS